MPAEKRTVTMATTLEWECSPPQAEAVFADDAEHVLMVCGEAAGGTHAAAMRAIRYACEHAGSRVSVAFGPRGSHDTVGAVLRRLAPRPLSERAGDRSMTLGNGSVIARGCSPDVRGTVVSVAVPWDWSRGRPPSADDLWRPLLTITTVDAEKATRGPFSRRVHAPSTSNPFVAPQFWSNLRSLIGEGEYRRRVLAEGTA